MGEVDKFCLRWNDFEQNIIGAFKDLRTDRDFFDCSIVCKDETFQAHRVILAACSPIFREMIRNCSHHHPVLYLRGVRRGDMLALLDFMYHGETSLAEEELEVFMETAEDLKVRGLTLSEKQQQQENERSRRVSGSNLANAVDDDVNNLLAGLDEPPSKRVKQEAHKEAERGFSITTSTGASAMASVQEKIRIKQEQREQEQEQERNIAAAKQRLASLPNSIVLQKANENGPSNQSSTKTSYSFTSASTSASTTSISTDYTPPPGITMTKPASHNSAVPQATPVSIRNVLDVTSLSADQRNSELLKALNISNAHISASTPVPVSVANPISNYTTTSAAQINQLQQQQPRPNPAMQIPRMPQAQQGARPALPQINTRLPQQITRPTAPQLQVTRAPIQTSHSLPQASHQNIALNQRFSSPIQLQRPSTPVGLQQQGLTRLQLQTPGRSSSPPVLHLPEGFSNFPVNTVGNIGGLLDASSVLPQNSTAGANETVDSDSSSVGEDPEYQRQIEAYIEKIQTNEGPKLRCKACQKTSQVKSKSTLINHIEATHIQANVLCNFCNKSFKARSYLKQHQKRGSCAAAAAASASTHVQ